jgi:hypothetical protein
VDAAVAFLMKKMQGEEQSMKSSGEHLVRLFTRYAPSAERTYQTRTSTKKKRRKKMPDINYHNKMIVTDSGICQRLYIDDKIFADKIVITKEAFIEAYNRYIKEAENEDSN